ncbi:MAG: MarR family transcriptional regulator [Pseudomonadota bacterium]
MSSPDELILACRALYDAIDSVDQKAADEAGVSRNDLRALNLLSQGPRNPGIIATELGLTTGSVTALLDRLEAKGLVKRSRSETDRRSVIVSPTPDLFEAVGPIYLGVVHTLRQLATAAQERGELEGLVETVASITRAYAGSLSNEGNRTEE